MAINLMRVDDRLIHSQIVIAWSKSYSTQRILIVDDVISTGKSLEAIEELVTKAGGNIVGKAAVLAEGDAIGREDIIYLEKLPLFFK